MCIIYILCIIYIYTCIIRGYSEYNNQHYDTWVGTQVLTQRCEIPSGVIKFLAGKIIYRGIVQPHLMTPEGIKVTEVIVVV